MNLLITEVRAGKREGSVVSVQTFNSAAHRDQETWDALRRELEDIGILPGVIAEKRHFIIAWFQEAVAAGELEEDVPSEGPDESAHDSDSLNDRDEAESSTNPTRIVAEHRSSVSSNAAARREPEETARKPGNVLPGVYDFQEIFTRGAQTKQKAESGPSQEQKKAGKMRHRISDLVNSLQAPDKQVVKAIHAKDAVRVGLALDKGADIELKDVLGYSPLSLASASGSLSVVQVLLDRGAETESKTSSGFTPLIKATSRRYPDQLAIIHTLLKHGANVNASTLTGITPLISAASWDVPEVIELLLWKSPLIDAKTSDGQTALMEAAYQGRMSIVNQLIINGANAELKDRSGDTALSIAERSLNMMRSNILTKSELPLMEEMVEFLSSCMKPEST